MIQFTAQYDVSTRSVSYLDTTVRIVDNRIVTDLYRKQSDRNTYLLPSSCHPSHVSESIPFSLCLRLVRICTEQGSLERRTSELKTMLLERNYKARLIDNAIAKAMATPRDKALEKVHHEAQSRITFVVTYSPCLPPLRNIVQKHYTTLTRDYEMKQIFDKPPMIAFRQPKNLKKTLCRAKLPPLPTRASQRIQNITGLRKCLKSNCRTCELIDESPHISTEKSSHTHTNKDMYTCESKSVIYMISCKKCNKQYVGQTGRMLKERMSEHLGYIAKNTEATGKHFNKPGHSLGHFKIQIIEQVIPNSRSLRETREAHWIQSLVTKEPHGLNRKD